MRTALTRVGIVVAAAALVLGAWMVTGQVSAHGASAKPKVTSASTPVHTLSVTGHGEVQETPNMASLTLGVDAKATDAAEALSKDASAMTAVIAAIEGQGVPANRIQTSNLSLYHDDQTDQYVASHQLDVRVDDVSKVGAVLDSAVAAGANNSWGVSFGLQDPSTGQTDALKAAIANARKRADAMAGALSVTITGVASASDGSSYSSPPINYGAVAAVGAPSKAPTPVQPGQLTISADVNVSYTISP